MIPGLDTDDVTVRRLESAFSNWAQHFRRRLHERGIRGLLLDYEELVRSGETQTCDHGAGLNVGEQWRWCCGVSYEYSNDLTVRDALQTIIEIVGTDCAQDILTTLGALDDRLYRF